MSKSILKQLYDGEIYPSENVGNDCPELQKIHSVLGDEKEKFLKTLSESDCETFNRLEDLENESAAIYAYECFTHGFKLAIQLMIESLGGAVKYERNGDK